MSELDRLLRKYESSDKVSNGYLAEYYRLAKEVGAAGRILELGVREGMSLLIWKELFPYGTVMGVDNDKESQWPDGTVKLIASQDDPEVVKLAQKVAPDGWDIIVDDASHVGELTAKSFDMLWPLLRKGGWYVIEDWHVGYLPYWREEYDTQDSMLQFATKLLSMFGEQADRYPGVEPGEVDEIRYLWGRIFIHKSLSVALPEEESVE